MIYLGLSVAASTVILLLFRWMREAGVNSRIAIAINYFFASATGFIFFDHAPELWNAPWFWPAAAEGIFFYLVFRLIAKTTQTSGVAAASIATKMSVVIPVLIGLFFLDESFTILKISGIALGLIAVILSSMTVGLKDWKWPLLAFVCSGIIDSSLKLFQVWTVSEPEFPSLITVIFSFAFLTGITHHLTFADRSISTRNFLGGMVLGLVNFGSLLFLLWALDEPNWESSTVFPINNVGVVTLSSILALVLFKERPQLRTIAGIFIAVVAILLLFLSS
jgi:drug/metabolite transporter (DMT)-like permease